MNRELAIILLTIYASVVLILTIKYGINHEALSFFGNFASYVGFYLLGKTPK